MNLRQLLRDDTPQSVLKASFLVFCSCLLALTALAWGIAFVSRYLLHLGFPFSTPLYDPRIHFTDLTNLYSTTRNLRAGGSVLLDPRVFFNYPAPALYVNAFFICLFRHPVRAIVSFDVGIALVGLMTLWASLRRSVIAGKWINISLLITALCSYPFMIVIDRGNIEGVVWVFTFIGLAFFI